jgi:molybdenum cofactor biosynthesis protein B
MAYDAHHATSQHIVARCAVVTLSDTRTESTDTSGQAIRDLLSAQGHTLTDYRLIPDDAAVLKSLLDQFLASPNIDAVLTNGGTGISPRDQTIEIVTQLLDRPLPGFGELFRMLSWEQIKSGSMLSRAEGGVARGKLLFAMPGSTKAVQLAMERLILPELRHLVSELKK